MKVKLASLCLASVLVFSLLFANTSTASVFHYPKPVIPAHCNSVNGLPDPKCTPGVANPDVTQDNLQRSLSKSRISF